ncbi:MAG: hypothetical protein AAGA47_10215 [Pseudomonadota bacterium]
MNRVLLIFLAAVAFMTLKTLMQAYSEYSVAILAAFIVAGGVLWWAFGRRGKEDATDE